MADRPRGFGLSAELQRKTEAKYDSSEQAEVQDWINAVLGEQVFSEGETNKANFQATLKDGVVLCRLINTLKPGTVKKINESKMAFKMMENIGNFLSGCDSLGVPKSDSFQTVDLYEGKNIPQVISGIKALGRKSNALGLSSVQLGPKEAAVNKRDFTEQQLKEGQTVIGLQMGSNKGASQSGDHFGRPRQVAGANVYK